ncbi:hypothetical protein H5410_048482 [Solanum commersonii]|uniref:Uncharacterized protein n=1 Tax=Solanum commersonii TaxID=4109 RepID=A0A9J5XLX3_SOLCO|nr:hypothetical protein H5410_048482 [Solanum commersonii]
MTKKSSDFSYKDSTDVVSADLSHVGPITRRKFKNSGLDGSRYFTSLEAMKNNNSHMMVVSATPRGNLTSVFFEEFSQIGSNFGESEDSMDALMADSTDIDEKFAMIEQTIEASNKYVNDKNLHIAQLMNKLEAFTPGESSHVPTCPFGFDQQNKDVEEFLSKSKFQKEKQPLDSLQTIVSLQDMITNTIRAQYGETPQSSLLNSFMKDSCGNQIGATHVISSIDETKGSKCERNLTITQEHQTDEKKHAEADSINLEDSKVQWAAIKISKKRTEEVSINLSPSKGDMQANVDDEQLIFCYIPRERQKKGTTTATGMYSTSSPIEERLSHTTFQDLKENKHHSWILRQVSIFHFGAFRYNFSNPSKLGELTEEVTGEKIHGLPEPLQISFKKGKEITSSHYTSIEKTKESKEGKTPQFEPHVCTIVGRLTPRVYALKDWLLEHENQDSCDITDDKKIHSVFPSCVKRKIVLSITTDGSLRVKRSTIVVTNQFHEETNKEEDEAVTLESQMEDSNLTKSSYHITMKEGSDIDDTNDDVKKAQLSGGWRHNRP